MPQAAVHGHVHVEKTRTLSLLAGTVIDGNVDIHTHDRSTTSLRICGTAIDGNVCVPSPESTAFNSAARGATAKTAATERPVIHRKEIP